MCSHLGKEKLKYLNMENSTNKMFRTSFRDKKGDLMREGDYISLEETKTMNDYDNDLLHNDRVRFSLWFPYRGHDVTGSVIYLLKWDGATIVAEHVKGTGTPRPSFYLKSCFKSENYTILGNIHKRDFLFETKSCLDGIKSSLTQTRRDGNTTRCTDNAIQLLFKGYEVIIEDHLGDEVIITRNKHLLERILKRLHYEHSIKKDRLKIFYEENGETLLSFKKSSS